MMNGASATLAWGIAYAPFGPHTGLTFGNGLADARSFDSRYTLGTADSGTTGTYSYDGDGRRVKKVAGGVTTIYFYDNDGKLL